MPEPKYWLSGVPGFCETCAGPIHKKFYDAVTQAGPRSAPAAPGPWACMCETCFTLGPGFGKLGQGFGQEYTESSDGKWYKTGG